MSERKRDTGPNAEGQPPDKLIPFLTAPGLFSRMGRAAGTGALIFLVAWYMSYLFLPEGFLPPGRPAGAAYVAAAVIAGNLFLRVRGLPFGYLAAAWGFLWAGVTAGTNSFLAPYSERIQPTFRIFSRGMVYEMIAWAVLAAASSGWALFEMERIGAAPRRIPGRATTPELLAALAGALILATALVLEAAGILTA